VPLVIVTLLTYRHAQAEGATAATGISSRTATTSS